MPTDGATRAFRIHQACHRAKDSRHSRARTRNFPPPDNSSAPIEISSWKLRATTCPPSGRIELRAQSTFARAPSPRGVKFIHFCPRINGSSSTPVAVTRHVDHGRSQFRSSIARQSFLEFPGHLGYRKRIRGGGWSTFEGSARGFGNDKRELGRSRPVLLIR